MNNQSLIKDDADDIVTSPEQNSNPHSPSQQMAVKKTIVVIAALVTIILCLFLNKILSPRVLAQHELLANGAVRFDKARIIDDFSLLDENAKPVDLDLFKDKWTLVFFGFSSCPDICPTTLATLSQWHGQLKPKIAEKTQIVLVSVDPARDSPEVLKDYISHFHMPVRALTGDFLQIKHLANDLNAAFNKVVMGDDYTVDHSAHIALVNPYGHYQGFFKAPFQISRLKLTFQSIVTTFPD